MSYIDTDEFVSTLKELRDTIDEMKAGMESIRQDFEIALIDTESEVDNVRGEIQALINDHEPHF